MYGEKDADGFYHGEINRRFGLVPSNMVCEIDKDEAYQLITADQHRTPYREFRYSDAGQYGGRRGSPLVDRRRRSDAGWQQNNSDPALSKHRCVVGSMTAH